MKTYEYIKDGKKRTAKLFGLPLMEIDTDYQKNEKYQKFLGGIVCSIKKYKRNCSVTKDIKLFGISIIKCIEENSLKKYYIYGIKIWTKSALEDFKKKYLKFFDEQYDDIYILKANSGETCLLLTYFINSLIKKNNSKNPLLVATQDYHIDIIKMLCPDISYIQINGLHVNIPQNSFKINGFRFFVFFNQSYFIDIEEEINRHELGKVHYFGFMLDYLNMNLTELAINKMSVLQEASESMFKKVQKIGLNLDHFVFLAPEARSCQLYNDAFWVKLINKLYECGYDVFINLADNKIDLNLNGAHNYKTCNLSMAEAFSLARKSEKIITLRSGFSECLLRTRVPIFVLYTEFVPRLLFKDIDSRHVMAGFSLKLLPYVDTGLIREFDTSVLSQNDLLASVLAMGNKEL